MEKTLCYSELSGHTFRPDIKKSKSHALFSLLNPWSNEGCFFVTPFPGSAGGSVQPFFGQTVNAKIIGRFSPFLMSAIGH